MLPDSRGALGDHPLWHGLKHGLARWLGVGAATGREALDALGKLGREGWAGSRYDSPARKA